VRNPALDRRRLLVTGLGLALCPATSLARGKREGGAPVLVLVQLAGGNDGLSTVVPWADDAYHAARRSTRRRSDEVLKLDEYRGLHSDLLGLHRRFQDGKLAIVEGVGYPGPNRSHFKSYEIWHTANERGRNSGDGWIGRLCAAAFGDDVHANRVVHLGTEVPYSLHSAEHPAAAFTSPAGYRWVKHDEELARVESAEETGEPSENAALALLRERMRDARASSAALRAAVARYRTPVEYASDPFSESLLAAAAVLHGDIGTRVLSLELGGFDTHNDERSRHDALMRTLDRGLASFLDDLERSDAGRQAIVLVFSEFGRRVAENGSRGTDHGTAGPMLVAGSRVRGGLYGEHPSLTDLDQGDLVHGTDFRSVYAAAIEACFDLPARTVLGKDYPALGLIG